MTDPQEKPAARLTHFDQNGASRMVDVSSKAPTVRTARATALVLMQPATMRQIRSQAIQKGDVLQVARIAGISGAKATSSLIPLCHPLPLTNVEVEFSFIAENQLQIEATTRTVNRTGVEMEALTAVTVASLTVYDMCKSIDRSMEIRQVRLEEKAGGKSGHYLRDRSAAAQDKTPDTK